MWRSSLAASPGFTDSSRKWMAWASTTCSSKRNWSAAVSVALWRHAVDTARGLGHAALIVVSDPNAEGFYLKMGCRRIGTRPSELENGRQLPLLRLAL